MKSLVTIVVFFLQGACALAQNAGPSPQSGLDKPGMTQGAKPSGAMDTTGMSSTKGNVKRETDGAPAVDKRKNPALIQRPAK